MRKLSLLLAATLFAAPSTLRATPRVIVDQTVSASGDNYAVFLDTSDLDGMFNSIRVTITPDSDQFAEFLYSIDGFIPPGPGDDWTFTNLLLGFPPPGGYGFSTVGASDDGPQGFSYTSGPLGAVISVDEPIFFNNIVLPTGNTATGLIELIDTGVILAELPCTLPVPEHMSYVLVCLGVVSMAGLSRGRQLFNLEMRKR